MRYNSEREREREREKERGRERESELEGEGGKETCKCSCARRAEKRALLVLHAFANGALHKLAMQHCRVQLMLPETCIEFGHRIRLEVHVQFTEYDSCLLGCKQGI